jgi:two-component system LytT family response regulator
MIRVLILDDHAASRRALQTLLAEQPGVVLVGATGNPYAARALLDTAEYNLVFLATEIAGDSGFELMARVRAGAGVILMAVHLHDASRAFEVNAIDFLVKPVRPERLAQTLARALRRLPHVRRRREDARSASKPSAGARGITGQVSLTSGKGGRFTAIGNISAILAQENYTSVLLADGRRVLVRRSLKAWADLLCARTFVRVHRTTLINLARVTRYERAGPKTILLHLAGRAEPIRASQRAWSGLRVRLAAQHGAE